MTIQEIDSKINEYEVKSFAIKMYVNSAYPTNFKDLIDERNFYKRKIASLMKQKKRQLKLERILNENR